MEKGLFNKFAGFSSNSGDQEFGDVSRISRSVVIKGDISSSADIRIDGRVEGMVYSKNRVIVGEDAKLKGRIFCEELDFCGELEGDVYVNDILTLNSTAVVNGNLNVRKLQVELGAKINGACKMIDEAEYRKTLSSKVKLEMPEEQTEESEPESILVEAEQAETTE